MGVNLSIKSVPESLVEQLRKRAERNHRSLQGELLTILELSLGRPPLLSTKEVIQKLRKLDIETKSDSAISIREDRDER